MHVLRGLAVAATALALAAAAAEPRIVRPGADQVVHSNNGTVAVQVADAPPGSRLLPVLDGLAQGKPQPGPVLELHGVNRGTHVLEVVVIEGHGEGGRTDAVTFHLKQASRLLPQRRTP